ncbi:fimbrial protein [Acinetobacter courvalinii]|uniref:fimbrial protein n=1 Tax=Acinetobacter courvalinii TaxID=280147 RepID=UPI0021D1B851|nr:fimbrial protein [Acinetobacter courvalinii]MCU4639193.1 fimbrial protein [Acinetobacter courvalinii]
MNLSQYRLNIAMGLILMLFSPLVFSANITCPANPTSSLYPGNPDGYFTVDTANFGSVWGAASTKTIESYSLVDCTPLIKHGITRWEYFSGNSNQIDISQTYVYGGNTYYKLKNTSSEFLNKYGYITFKFGESFGTKLELSKAFPKYTFYDNATGVLSSPSQGLMAYDIDFVYTAAPTEAEQVEINLGKLEAKYLSTDAPGDTFFVEQNAYIKIDLNPAPRSTCDFDIPPVQMSTISLKQLGSVGAQYGFTRFGVKVNCDSALAGKMLFYNMIDSADLSNVTDVLTNTEGVTSNVGIKIYEYESRKPVFFNTEYEFGRLGSSSYPTVSKDFFAEYYRRDNNPIIAGSVSAQAMIYVVYK